MDSIGPDENARSSESLVPVKPEWLMGHAQLFWHSVDRDECLDMTDLAIKPLSLTYNNELSRWELWQLLGGKGDF